MSLLSAHLKTFLAIVEQGTVHRAAEVLNLTQTGVTQRLRALESDLGTTLFLRSRRGMKMTAEGEALLRYCRSANELEGQVLGQITGATSMHPIEVNLAGPTSVMTARIAELCLGLYSQWPQLHLNLIVTDAADRIQRLRTGEYSLAVVPPEHVANEMDSKRLRSDKYVLVASPLWKGRRLSDIIENERVIDFDSDDPTTLNYLKKFNLIDSIKRPRLFVNDNDVIARYFAQGIGYGTLTLEIAKPYLDAGELIALNGGATLEDALALAWYPRPEMPKYFKAIIQAVK